MLYLSQLSKIITFEYVSQDTRDYKSDMPKVKIFFSYCTILQQAKKVLEIEISFIKTDFSDVVLLFSTMIQSICLIILCLHVASNSYRCCRGSEWCVVGWCTAWKLVSWQKSWLLFNRTFWSCTFKSQQPRDWKAEIGKLQSPHLLIFGEFILDAVAPAPY